MPISETAGGGLKCECPAGVFHNGVVTLLALFDLDNTLLDRENAFGLWADRFIASHGLGQGARAMIDRADVDGATPRDEFFARIRQELNITTEVDELVADYRVVYPSLYSAEPEMIKGVRLLRSSGFKVGVVTNGPPSQQAKLEAAGVAVEFDAVCISGMVGSRKPDIAIFREAARVCNLPLDGWMVGDSAEADIVGGGNAGLKTIWMARGRDWPSDDFVPDHIVDSIPQAVDVILAST